MAPTGRRRPPRAGGASGSHLKVVGDATTPPGLTPDLRIALEHVTDSLVAGEGSGLDGLTSLYGLESFDAVAVLDLSTRPPEVVAATCPAVETSLSAEGELGQGPVSTAADTGEPVVCRDLRDDHRWPAFRDDGMAGRVALRRWVVVPLGAPGEAPVGALVLAAAGPGIVTAPDLASIGVLADQACLVLTAQLGVGREARALLAMDDVRVVAIAVGRLMESRGLEEDEALAWLKVQAHTTGRRVADIARHLDP